MSSSFSLEYQKTRQEVNSQPALAPRVLIHDLSTEEGKKGFYGSLRELPAKLRLEPWTGTTDEQIFIEALKRGIILDQMPLQLTDLLLVRQPAGSLVGREKAVARYSKMYSLPQNGVFVEYEFEKGDGRFIHTLSPDDLYSVMFSRNKYAISPEVQQILRNNKYALAGASVGGMVAWLLLMSGAENLTIADGGPLKLHSFDRINFAGWNILVKIRPMFSK